MILIKNLLLPIQHVLFTILSHFLSDLYGVMEAASAADWIPWDASGEAALAANPITYPHQLYDDGSELCNVHRFSKT